MRHLAVLGRVTVVGVVAGAGLFASPGPAAAECTYIPALPKISFAIPTAKELFAGTVTSIGASRGDFTVRVDEVFRGSAAVGSVRTMAGVAPNWPTDLDALGSVQVSCAVLNARRVGEKVAIALGARFPGGILHSNGYDKDFYQPPTTFNTIAILEGSPHEQYGSGGRQLFSLKRLRELAAIFPPPTDTLEAPAVAPASAWSATGLLVLIGAGFLGGAIAWRRTRRST